MNDTLNACIRAFSIWVVVVAFVWLVLYQPPDPGHYLAADWFGMSNTAGINEAIAYADKHWEGSATIELPRGAYTIRAPFISNVTIDPCDCFRDLDGSGEECTCGVSTSPPHTSPAPDQSPRPAG